MTNNVEEQKKICGVTCLEGRTYNGIGDADSCTVNAIQTIFPELNTSESRHRRNMRLLLINQGSLSELKCGSRGKAAGLYEQKIDW